MTPHRKWYWFWEKSQDWMYHKDKMFSLLTQVSEVYKQVQYNNGSKVIRGELK